MIRATWFAAILFTLSIYGTMAMMSIAAALLVLAWVWESRKSLFQNFRTVLIFPHPYQFTFWTYSLAFFCAWSLVWAKYSDLEFMGKKPDIHWVSDMAKLWHLLFTLIFFGVLKKFSERKLQKLVRIWLGGAFFSALLGIVQHFIPLYQSQRIPNIEGTFYHATGLAGFHLSYVGIIGFPMMVWLMFFTQRRSPLLKQESRFVFYLGSIAFLLSQLFAYSKTNWIAVLLVVGVLLFLSLQGKMRILGFFGFLLLVIGLAELPSIQKRLSSEQLFYGTLRDRLYVWSANAEMIKQYPLFGVGWHHNSDLSAAYYDKLKVKDNRFESHAHNNFIDQWATTGVFGLLCFIGFCISALLLALKLARQKSFFAQNLGIGILFGWFLLHFNGFTQTNFWDAKILHQISWVIAFCLVFIWRRQSKQD